MARMNDLGVRGVRINTSPVKPPEQGYAESLLPRIRRIEARCAEIGWHLDFLCPGWLTTELMGCFRGLKTPYSLAHMGMYLARDGVGQPGFQQLLDLLRNGNGNAWVKFTGTYRMSKAPGFADVAPMAQALIEAAPDRIIWGSDYPHLSFADKVSSSELFNLLAVWAPDAGARRAILVDNPGRLFGF
jgi:predicted TIM-barrel fold metal-dependent hydrolase